jgi:hypothetical protein
MYYKNVKTSQIINWDDMEFGTIEKSFCGICNNEEDGHFDKNQELVEDIICNSCSKDWIFYVDSNSNSDVDSDFYTDSNQESESESVDLEEKDSDKNIINDSSNDDLKSFQQTQYQSEYQKESKDKIIK